MNFLIMILVFVVFLLVTSVIILSVSQKKNAVHILQHENKNGDVKIIGIYSSSAKAQKTKKLYANLKGFDKHPDGFFIDKYNVNSDYWTEGFKIIELESKL